MQKVYIKNMVCPRCIDAVNEICQSLGLEVNHLKLGELQLKQQLSESTKNQLNDALKVKGFELLQEKSSMLIERIKNFVIDQVRYNDNSQTINFSSRISEALNQGYSSLSRKFSSVEGITIEKYLMRQKIEYVKELLFYDELSLTEIANKLDYSSVAHLSAQFKKETGMSPSNFKKLKGPQHYSISD